MARPLTLTDLAASVGEPIERILIKCVFCSEPLTISDKVAFEVKVLSIVWCGDRYFGVCVTCSRARSYLDVLWNRGPCLEAEGLEALLNKPLSNIAVRCQYCLALLSFLEKLICAIQKKPFLLVRTVWRNTCSECAHYDR
nr:MAG: E6 protein [Hydrurga leptonyx papillomavirus 3]